MIPAIVMLSVLLVYIAFVLISAFAMYRAAAHTSPDRTSVWNDPEPELYTGHAIEKFGDDLRERRRRLIEHACSDAAERVSVTSHDGLRLEGRILHHESPRAVIAMFHGYRSNPLHDFGDRAEDLFDDGFTLFLAEQRAQGASEGKAMTYGALERYDAVLWCRYLAQRFPGVPIVLYGVSMGAATVSMASSLELPREVCCVIADCGYTSPADISRSVMKRKYHLPSFPVYNCAALLLRLFAKYDPDGCSSVTSLASTTLPVMIAHGSDDSFVPYEMGERLASACEGCIFLSAPGAAHGEAYMTCREEYRECLRELFGRAGIPSEKSQKKDIDKKRLV